MNKKLSHNFSENSQFLKILSTLTENKKCGIVGTNVALLSAISNWLNGKLQRPILILTQGSESAEKILLNLQTFCEEEVTLFSAHTWQQEDALPNVSVNMERIETLTGLLSGKTKIVVAPFFAVLQKLPSPEIFIDNSILLEIRKEFDVTELLRNFFELGYERTDMVEFRGEFSARGGIVDVYPVTFENPVRIEFFGDEIVSIRTFEIHSQRSFESEELKNISIPPARESSVGALQTESQNETETEKFTILDYFKNNPLIVWNEFSHIVKEINRREKEKVLDSSGISFNEWQTQCSIFPALFAQELELDVPDIILGKTEKIKTETFSLVSKPGEIGEIKPAKPYQFTIRALVRKIQDWKLDDFSVSIVCGTDAERDRLSDLLNQESDLKPSYYQILTATLTDGWILPDCKQVVITDDEIFQRVYTRQRKHRKHKKLKTKPIENIATIKVGELVVHINHGIGQFEGIKNIKFDEDFREMIIVRYADDALLYVPLSQAHLIEKYIKVGGGIPQLDSLGSGKWSARKRKAEKAVLDLAAELLERQAERDALDGFSFQPDGEWQVAFEKAFPYVETTDQETAIKEMKTDMESSKPMDRLICGDVGFGKTEVAIRAAFKAALSGKQVAVLAPTTVLVQQHWHTFSERMAEYPVQVEMLCRFVSPRNQKEIIKTLVAGQTDIVIGTHRLLSKDIQFKNLGLIIVDEEQRFGVRHKEKLKKLKHLADVLTLSATPIPRTLYQSLTGARDMSTILTPPEERNPVKTLLIKKDKKIIREAILRELSRDGQVFYLHNRVETIEKVRDKLQELVPTADLVIAHGQMYEKDLSQAMEDFAAGKHDVMVCTTVVESGLDLPNVNTIIIDNAERFGLADLYQLRGRVGRSTRQAYAYLVVPGDLALETTARHRLKAILENTALGSGYTIAMKDLEIRGAGNLLGQQQSGHIVAIGFTLYCKLLQRAVDLLKKVDIKKIKSESQNVADESDDSIEADILVEKIKEKPKKIDWRKEIPAYQPTEKFIELILPFAGNIPEEFVESPTLRLELFQRIGNSKRVREIRNLEEEIRDRFGKLPDDAVLLLRIAEARIHAKIRGINSIEIDDKKVIMRRMGKILTPTSTFPRINISKPLESINIILAYISQLKPLVPEG